MVGLLRQLVSDMTFGLPYQLEDCCVNVKYGDGAICVNTQSLWDVLMEHQHFDSVDTFNGCLQMDEYQKQKHSIGTIHIFDNEHCKIQDFKVSCAKNRETAGISDLWKHNLIMLDSFWPPMMKMIVDSCIAEGSLNVKDILNLIIEKDPIEFGECRAEGAYEYKMRRLLVSLMSGLKLDESWDGRTMGGGIVWIGDDGRAFHSRFIDECRLGDFLIEETMLTFNPKAETITLGFKS